MRKNGAWSVDVGSVSVRFRDTECTREHAMDDEPSEEEWQRRHRWFEAHGELTATEVAAGKDCEEDWEDSEDLFPPEESDPTLPDDRAPDPAPSRSEDEKFDEWYSSESLPPAPRR